MGNSTSNAVNPNSSDLKNNTSNSQTNSQNSSQNSSYKYSSPIHRAQSPAGSPSPTSNRVHRSLRTKKKSLELPDLASLALTPALNSPNASPHAAYRRPRASSPIPIPNSLPIPIPTSPNPPQPTFRVQNNLPSAAHIAGAGGRRYAKSYLNSPYPSTHSFTTRDRDDHSPPRQEEPAKHEFVPEIVHSTIPLALPKAEGDGPARPEHVTVTIKWRGGGKTVVLARAGDDYWKGRQPMDYDPETKVWSTQIHVLPGTHHFKFLVDDQWRIAEEYPTAVDDLDGSLANYVNASSPSTISPSSSSPQPTPYPASQPNTNQFASFFSDASSSAWDGVFGRGEAAWTAVIPQELVNAAAEEENYLASADSPTSSSSVPTPNIPPAPVLPRHLDKLILNVRPQIASASASGTERERDRERERKKEREKSKKRERERERDKESRARAVPQATLGMTAADCGAGADGETHPSPPLALPITTASGTDVSALATSSPPTPASGEDCGAEAQSPAKGKRVQYSRIDPSGLADDASVLPVPSHVVLHHLSTSAIRNGVLAVANTTRYRKKYITTIYYKPT